ncbi:MAG: hypothetical protein GY856_21200 [bacterium]|nr:hypothetical protein [bacterium]
MNPRPAAPSVRAFTLLLLALTCAAMFPAGTAAAEGDQSPGADTLAAAPHIFPPPVSAGVLARPDDDQLPNAAQMMFPAYDGDTFFVTLPATEAEKLTWEEVYATVVAPALAALGFERTGDLLIPDGRGVEQPQARLDNGLTDPLTLEFTAEEVEAAEQASDEELSAYLEETQGMTLEQYRADIERLEIQYPFRQMVGRVPIEHTIVLASRWDGETVSSITGRVFNNYAVTNNVVLSAADASGEVLDALLGVEGITGVGDPPDRVELLLLPTGGEDGVPGLRYAWRMPVAAAAGELEGIWFVWLDAETGKILQLVPLDDAVTAGGRAYRRDPGLLPATDVRYFQVDPAVGGQYVLARSGVFNRVDFQGDGYNANDVSISDSTFGSSASFANFDQPTNGMNDGLNAICNNDALPGPGADETFQQVHFAGVLSNQHAQTLSMGIFTPFPTTPWSPRLELGFCNASSAMHYGACPGYFDPMCPNVGVLNTVHDSTVIGHELGHNILGRQYSGRPANWCVGPELEPGIPTTPCPFPWGNFLVHDYADGWGAHFDNTNCAGGWVARNQGGPSASLNCIANHDESGWIPRLHDVSVPFNPAVPEDHFPEHRTIGSGFYSDMQIGSAALWKTRLGMRSKDRSSGTPQYGVRFMRALRNTGWFSGTTPWSDDLGIYRILLDLEVKLLHQWFSAGSAGGPPAGPNNGPHTAGKVTSGFAKAGLFVIPYQCIDGDPTTSEPLRCPTGELGADAVVDIDDNNPGDDPAINGVIHPEVDYLQAGGPPPTFHVWTGPRYVFTSTGGTTFPNPSPCHPEFQVEIANDEFFTVNTAVSGYITVDRNPATPAPECYGTWTPSPLQWVPLASGSRLYYRVRTRNTGGGDPRISVLPGNGLFTFPPPYAIINATGKPGCAVARFEYLGGTGVQRLAALIVMLLPLATIAGLRRRAWRRR